MAARLPQSLLLLDDDEDVLEALALSFEGRGTRCLRLRSVAELLSAAEVALGCMAALLDVNLGPGEPTGLDAYRWLESQGFKGRVVFLTGHAHAHPLLDALGTAAQVL